MAYSFGTAGYRACLTAPEPVDTEKLRADVLRTLEAFDPKAWHDAPMTTLLRGEVLQGDQRVETVDAFGHKNGSQVLAAASSVDRVIEHVHGFRVANADLRGPVRAIEDVFFKGPLAAELVAYQALDFHKQDGITEIEESQQALLVERRLNDALLEDEGLGKLVIGRAAAFVGCVSNFTNFLDLCRKILRNMEVGVPVVVLSRSNTTQHMYRYTVRLLEQMREHGLDLGLCTFCSCSIEEQRRLLGACRESPMYFTGSRAVACRIKEVAPRLVASTGGPNTMVVGEGGFSPEVATAARMSNLIEHKGQCTALRHLVLPRATEADVRAMYADAQRLPSEAEALRSKEFGALLHGLAQPIAEGYHEVPLPAAKLAASVAVRISKELPASIDEQWREAYLDVTAPADLGPRFIPQLTAWLNREQPISLAMNCSTEVARELFEETALVVYTVGNAAKGAPALTAQARPQDGECFGEFPPRRELEAVTSFPVIIPSSTPGYNSEYSPAFLKTHGAAPPGSWGLGGLQGCITMLRRCRSPEERGYGRVLLEYLADAARGPGRGVGARTALFGLQRPPLRSLCCLRLEKASGPNLPHSDALFDEAVRYILPFAATSAREQLVISLDPFLSFPAFPMLAQQGLKVVRESKEAFAAAEGGYWSVVSLPRPASGPKYPLAAHFVSKLFPMGHIKSTLSNDEAFVQAFTSSPKWLHIAAAGASTATPASKM
mmetsp:Transcript_71242/g.201929  ORF Transcript_71242/g.201929 Transcript_71242/m.201929 type:complete len:720 (+) Transcript_71242:2-2161(+)